MDKAVAVTLVVYYHFSSLRVVLHLRKDAQGTCECSTVSPSSQLCCCVPAFITQPHDEQEAAAVISCHRMAGQGNFDLMYPFEAQHNNP